MALRSDKLLLFSKMHSATGEERFKIALQLIAQELDVLVEQLPGLPHSESSVANVVSAIKSIASIGHKALEEPNG